MTYRIARNGQIFGPYSLLEVQRYLASGQVIANDLAQSDTMQEWLPIQELFPTASMHDAPTHPGGLPHLFPDPPNIPWGVALLLGIVTALGFFVIWDIVESAWMRRVQPTSTALVLYIGVAVLYIIKLPMAWHTTLYNLGYGPEVDTPHATLINILSLILIIASRFVFRRDLLHHFNRDEPIGLRLNWLLTLLFGGLYFQYHFNRINQLKRTLRISVPTV